jgi:hypothetical protein
MHHLEMQRYTQSKGCSYIVPSLGTARLESSLD